MKKFLLLVLFANVTFSQIKKSIDSLNNIPFEIKQEKASSLDVAFLINSKKAISINDKLGEANSYGNLSLIYYYQGKLEKSLHYSLKSISIYEKIDNQEKLAYEYGELGYRMKKRNMPKALYYMQKAKNISEINNFEKPLLSIYNNYGYLKELQNQNDSALYFYKKGLIIKEKTNDSTGIPYSLNNIALIYIKQGKYNQSLKLLDKSLKIRNKLKDQNGIAENNFYLGDLNFKQNKYKEALLFYNKSLQIALQINYLDLIQNCYLVIASCYEKLGNNKESLANLYLGLLTTSYECDSNSVE